MKSEKVAERAALEMFNVIGASEDSRDPTDRFMCMSCGALTLVAHRVSMEIEGYEKRLFLCHGCPSKPHEELKALLEPRPPITGPSYKLEGCYQNRLYENMVGMPTPVIGMGVTQMMYSDRHAYTIIEVKSPCVIVVQKDDAKLVKGSMLSENQHYKFSLNPNGGKLTLRKNRYGQWKIQGGSTKFLVGRRMEYRDPHF